MTKNEIQELVDEAVFKALADGLKTAFDMRSDHYDDWVLRYIDPMYTQIAILSNRPIEPIALVEQNGDDEPIGWE